ncbi:MAG: SMC family ATPase, partial [Candidatus Levybacteria bacterium]|nr:SMC family ATPase [Candidatus Levybacteria bacterium]
EGRMKVILETQRETKTKVTNIDGEKAHGIVETLDIIISDEMGERPYEMYSGGEAFRVNFAIRLAISKLLTHRAGAKLQFLVIDEGFGTQDAPGRARLIEVIDAIKDDFEKILIITHLEELKEEFPVRIEVSKNSTGSTFEVVGI